MSDDRQGCLFHAFWLAMVVFLAAFLSDRELGVLMDWVFRAEPRRPKSS